MACPLLRKFLRAHMHRYETITRTSFFDVYELHDCGMLFCLQKSVISSLEQSFEVIDSAMAEDELAFNTLTHLTESIITIFGNLRLVSSILIIAVQCL